MRYRLSLAVAALLVFGASHAVAQTRLITGRVTDSLTSEIITSGQVAVQGTTISSTINDDGTFTLGVPTRDVMLTIRSIGFQRRDVRVAANQNSVQAALERDFFQLEAIVVTGQATGVERRNLANAVASVTAAELTKVPAASIEAQLTGKLAGANIQSNSGAPGGGMQMRLRGVSSILGAATPLYVIDGVIASDVAIPTGVTSLTKGCSRCIASVQDDPINRISDINPNDIESVEVLKGASASAIYGSKAANGVVIITTKKGRIGAPQFTISQKFGTYDLSKKLGKRLYESRAEAEQQHGTTGGTEWQLQADHCNCSPFFDHDQHVGGYNPLSYETSASISGGTETTRYYVSGLVKSDGGIILNTGYDKQSLRLNIDQAIGDRLNFSIASTAAHIRAGRGFNNNDNTGVSLYMTMGGVPSFFDMRKPCDRDSGDLGYNASCDGPGNVYPINPFAESNLLQTQELAENRENVYRFLTAARLSWDAVTTPQHNLRFLVNGGVDYFTQKNEIFGPAELQFEPKDNLPGTYMLSSSYSQQLNLNTNLVYTFTPASGAFSATTSLGAQSEYRDLDISRARAENLVGGIFNIGRGTVLRNEEEKERVQDAGFFAQEEFLTLGDRLLLTAGVRADRSSSNSDIDKFHFYPKTSASFRFPVGGAIDEIKFRAAYGQSGNQPKYGQKFSELTAAAVSGLAAITVGDAVADPEMKPERQEEFEGGIDVTFAGGRATLEATVYQKNTKDLLLERNLAESQGFRFQIFNGGQMRTRGLEGVLALAPIQTPSIQWTSRATFTLDRTKIIELPVPRFRAGGFGFTYGGFYIEEGRSPTMLWGRSEDASGNLVETAFSDVNPDFRIGFSNDFTYKAISVYSLFDWQQGGTTNNLTKTLYDLGGNSHDWDVVVGQDAMGNDILNGGDRFQRFLRRTAVYFEDATFLKLRELTLSVELPRSFVNSFWSGARYVRIGASGRNLVTWTGYSGHDPEVSNHGNNAVNRNLDTGPYPPSRQFWFSVDVGF